MPPKFCGLNSGFLYYLAIQINLVYAGLITRRFSMQDAKEHLADIFHHILSSSEYNGFDQLVLIDKYTFSNLL